MAELAMRVWPLDGWVAEGYLRQPMPGIKVDRHEGGYLSIGNFRTWLDDEGGLVCTCGQNEQNYPCAHGAELLSKAEALRVADRNTHFTAERNRMGLHLDLDEWSKALLESFSDESERVEDGDGFVIGEDYLFPVGASWGACNLQAAQTIFALKRKAVSSEQNRIWLPETAMPDILELARTQVLEAGEDITRYLAFANRSAIVRPAPHITGTLDPAQQEGVNWLLDAFHHKMGGILADQMGVGKTLQIIAHIQALKDAGLLVRALISVPSGAVDHWMREIKTFAPNLDAIAWEGPTRSTLRPILDISEIVVTTHRIMTVDAAILRSLDWTVYALDEAQDAKNPESDLAVSSAVLPARQKIPVTGTPVENSLIDLHTLFTIAIPGLLGRQAHFRRDISDPVKKGEDEADAILEALHAVVAPFLKHRTQQSAGLSIPQPNIIRIPVDLQSDREAYEMVRDKAHLLLDGGSGGIFHQITRLRQASADYRLVAGSNSTKESSKTAWIADYVADKISRGRQVLIFSTWTTHLELLERAIVRRGISSDKIGRIDGAMNRRQKRWAEEDFKTGERPILQMTMKAGGRSLNLPEADDVIIGVPWWNPAVMMQAAYRAIRRGQTKTIDVAIPIGTDTIEERLMEIQAHKSQISTSILRPAAGSGGLTRRQLVELIRAS